MATYGNKPLDGNGLSHVWAKIKATFAAKADVPSPGSTTPAMDGTGATGTSADYARADHVHPTDTSRAPTSHASSATTYGKGTSGSYGHVKLSDATNGTAAASSGGTAATPKAVADALAAAKSYADGKADNDTTYTLGTTGSGASRKVTLTPSSGSAQSVDVPDTDTTYGDYAGSAHGLVPANMTPPSGASTDKSDYSLRMDGQWAARGYGFTYDPDDTARLALAGYDMFSSGRLALDPVPVPLATASASGAMSSADKTKLDGIADGANNYTHPAYTAASAAAVKVGRDATGHVVVGSALTASDVGAAASSHSHSASNITSGTLGVARGGTGVGTLTGIVKGNGTSAMSAATASDVVTLLGTNAVNRATADASGNDIADTYAKKADIAGVYRYKGSVAAEGNLPASPATGDVYNIESASTYGAAGANVAWNGTAWDSLGEVFQLDALTNAEIDAICV